MTKSYRISYLLPRALIVLHDFVMTALLWSGLRWLYEHDNGDAIGEGLYKELILVLLLQGLMLWWSGLYRGVWRFASLPDLSNILRAAILGLCAILLAFLLSGYFYRLPLQTIVLYVPGLAIFLGAPRLIYRAWKDQRLASKHTDAMRVIVAGAGRSAEVFLRDIASDGRYEIAGLLDDDPQLKGRKIQGVKVLGRIDQLPEIARATAADLCVIALPTAHTQALQRVVSLCDDIGMPFRKLGRFTDWLNAHDPIQLNEVAIDDLLGREPIHFDWQSIGRQLGGKCVLITGAGGSIGSELARQCAQARVRKLILLERAELSLLEICEELAVLDPGLEVVSLLADCGDKVACLRAMQHGIPDYVYHAAANKHVPLLEGHVREGLRNNVHATATLAEVCRDHGALHFVLISTDKAIQPINILGATKLMAERVCQAIFNDSASQLSIVRFGNVLDSSGSVVPMFRRQIAAGGPVTVTHEEVTRYFMTIPEACQLILQALSMPEPYAVIYTLDMGKPVAISELAEQMIRLAGKRPGIDIQIQYTGLRAGEKLHENLFHPDETYTHTENSRVLEAKPREINVKRVLAQSELLAQSLRHGDDDAQLLALLREAVPEYTAIQSEKNYK
ncbi:MAG: polysaccharide biosynthesis protein [Arenimonas sp.]